MVMAWTAIRVKKEVKDEFDLLYNALKKQGYNFKSHNEFFAYILADFMKRHNIEKMMIEFYIPKEFENAEI